MLFRSPGQSGGAARRLAGRHRWRHRTMLLASDSVTGKYIATADFNELNGIYNTTTKEYKLNITRHLQQILNGSVKDSRLYIVSGGVFSLVKIPTNSRRTVLNGGSSMKLNITYTQQNN